MKFIQLFSILLFCIPSYSQIDHETDFQKQYQLNIKKEYINDVYIPADFDEAFAELERLADPEAIGKFKGAPEEAISRRLHFGLGRWISVNWNYEGGSRLSHLMKEMGVTFPDDMVEMTIVSFHRHLNDIDIDLKGQSKAFFEKRKKENEERKKKAEVIAVQKG